MLPSDFPKWRSVYSYFKIWSEKKKEGEQSLLDQALTAIVRKASIDKGRREKTSYSIVDPQSVRNTDTAEEKGYDGGKQVSGIKRLIGVDTQGLPPAIEVTTAKVGDRDEAILMVQPESLSEVGNSMMDGSYTGGEFALQIKTILRPESRLRKEVNFIPLR